MHSVNKLFHILLKNGGNKWVSPNFTELKKAIICLHYGWWDWNSWTSVVPNSYTQLQMVNVPNSYTQLQMVNVPSSYTQLQMVNVPSSYTQLQMVNVNKRNETNYNRWLRREYIAGNNTACKDSYSI